jgi:hypothetical protein
MTGRRACLSVFLCAALLWAEGSASASIPRRKLAIGDSVMLGAKTDLEARGFKVNAVVSRQFHDGLLLVRSMAAAGTLPRKVVVHLGTNGVYYDGDCGRLVRAAGSLRTVWLVTLKVPRSYRAWMNRMLRRCARTHANTRLIDWYRYSHDHPGWFASDGYHLSSTGRIKYAALIASRVG